MSQDRKPADESRWGASALLLLAAFAAVAGAFWWMRGGLGAARPAHAVLLARGTARAPEARGAAGTIVRLQPRFGHPIWVVSHVRVHRDLRKAQLSGDSRAAQEILRAGLAFTADEDTQALILGEGAEFYRVRMLEGEQQGKMGWVPGYNLDSAGLERRW